MRIGISSSAVVLAAGLQTRFGEDEAPKCLQRLNGQTILGRLARQLNMPIVTVVGATWDGSHIAEAAEFGQVVKMDPGLSIGHSVAAGLEASREADQSLIIAADTVIPGHIDRVPRGLKWAILDPWEWIVLYALKPNQDTIDDCRDRCEDRVEYLWQARMPVDIIKTGWINVNTRKDLERARELCSG